MARSFSSFRQRSKEELLAVEFSEEYLLSLLEDDTSCILLPTGRTRRVPKVVLELLQLYY
jgi:hypothetical protein